ncbi:vWA domain-containing protein [uncultured Dokdonia sp.]|uniref:vWA domain-containing protein n=1 Tax=uncultured Dokdonia sp. TaxID=575653 RepID=UPI0026397E89|nr:vWA domain-containing protein [uncultured Dokdonia sp.]
MKTVSILITSLMIASSSFYPTPINNTEDQKKLYESKSNSIAVLDSKTNIIKVALLLDTSNSMDGLIDQAKSQLWELVNELSYAKCGSDDKPTLQIALYEYGNDRLNAKEGYIRQVNAFSNDLDEISKNLFALTTNGGNEYCGKVIQVSLDQLNWGTQKNDLNLIFIAGNEPFDQGPVRYQDASVNACEKDVTVNTIFCGDYNTGVHTYWKDGAESAKGNYIAINHDKRTVHVPSPYDQAILEKNKALNSTYIGYGRLAEDKMALQLQQDSNASEYGEANAVKRAVSKSSHFYKNSSWDLVDAEKEENFSYEALDDKDLPKELKGKSTSEIKMYIATKRKEREAIQKEIAQLNSQRIAYVASQTKKDDNQLRNAMIEAIKTQAKRKNYTWE